MKATLIESHGGLDRLLYQEVALPQIGPTDVLVETKTCGLNHLDLFVRKGELPVPIPLPRILGLEVTGIVTQVGSRVNEFREGDRVAALCRVGCEKCEYCLRNQENLCLKSRSLGMTLDGGYAEFVSVPSKNLVRIPECLSFLEVSGAPLSGLTAWHMLMSRAALRPKESVLIMAGGSSIGSFAIQIAKALGCRVFTTVGRDEKIEKAYRLGADFVIQRKKQNVLQEIRQLTEKRGVDLVFEHVGQATWDQSIDCLSRNGRIVTCGAFTGSEVSLDLWKLFSKQISIIGSYYGTNQELHDLFQFMEEQKVFTIIDSVFPLNASREAQAVLENEQHFGKVVLEVH